MVLISIGVLFAIIIHLDALQCGGAHCFDSLRGSQELFNVSSSCSDAPLDPICLKAPLTVSLDKDVSLKTNSITLIISVSISDHIILI